MATLINGTNPALRILVSEAPLRFRQFVGGKLEIEPDDPDYEAVIRVAQRTSTIRVVETAVWCPECQEPFAGKMARANLGAHRKEKHLDAYFRDQEASLARERTAIVLERSGIPCPLCPPSTERFPDRESIEIHAFAVHEGRAPIELGEDGETIGAVDRPDGGVPANEQGPIRIPPATG